VLPVFAGWHEEQFFLTTATLGLSHEMDLAFDGMYGKL
jgi:hypothetical protein